MNSFKQEIYQHYMTSNGAVHTMRDPDNQITSGNHHVINATFYAIQEKIGKKEGIEPLTKEDKEVAIQFIESTRDDTGIFNRAPNKLADDQSHDDLIAIAVTSNILGLQYAKEIYDYGNQWRFPKLFGLIPIPMRWYYDNTAESPNFNFKHWHYRFGWAVPIYKAAAGKELNFFDKFCYNEYMSSHSSNLDSTSGRIIRWLSSRIMKDTNRDAIDGFNWQIRKDYPFSMTSVLGIYHGEDHPFAKNTYSVDLLQ